MLFSIDWMQMLTKLVREKLYNKKNTLGQVVWNFWMIFLQYRDLGSTCKKISKFSAIGKVNLEISSGHLSHFRNLVVR